ncbi:hypothetical protein LuPra_03295 [Luteitalea pratensis]|uniref:Methanolan biosynthesis EpsI domain-containing protein n=1 Tax=Luteitalea pratensis TaxID=1855912 RepID=A0A143PN54_LUTPR|nr:hypothetical protein [Luteitalea pratensis]AMY10067.1 hypothetical protein LuPra_03295 [Luteitalea pratensis]
MISRRHVWPLIFASLLALLPTMQRGYVGGVDSVEKVTSARLPGEVAGVASVDKQRTGGWMANTYGADSWAERTYQVPGKGDVGLFVARGFDMKKLYHHPELGVLRGRTFAPADTMALSDKPDQIVHVLQSASSQESAVYALIHDGRWVDNPYALQLSSAVTTLWTGPKPLTLVFAYGPVLANGQPSPFTAELLRTAVRTLSPAQSERH